MTTMTPTIPLGPYPHLLLCPHVGITPTKARIRMIRRMVPIGSTNQRVKGVARQIEGKVQKGVGHIEQALDRARRKPR
jgi:hypothetical protein